MTKEEMSELKKLLEPINKKLEDLDNIKQRLEEVRIDTNAAKLDLMQIKLTQSSNTRNITIMKLDGEKAKEDIKGLIALAHKILDLIVTREEHEELKKRVRVLESI